MWRSRRDPLSTSSDSSTAQSRSLLPIWEKFQIGCLIDNYSLPCGRQFPQRTRYPHSDAQYWCITGAISRVCYSADSGIKQNKDALAANKFAFNKPVTARPHEFLRKLLYSIRYDFAAALLQGIVNPLSAPIKEINCAALTTGYTPGNIPVVRAQIPPNDSRNKIIRAGRPAIPTRQV